MKKNVVFCTVVGIFISANAFCVDFPVVDSDQSFETVSGLQYVPFPEPSSPKTHLKATGFPETFEDLSFEKRLSILREGYLPYRVEYDKNGVCVSGCAYPGITIKEDMDSVDEATNEIADLIWNYEQGSDYGRGSNYGPGSDDVSFAQDWCRNGRSTKLPLRYPVDMSGFRYKISSDFGFRKKSDNGARFHPAIDIACPSGTPVYATADGTVVVATNDPTHGGAGNYISIKHDNGLITQYLHLSKFLVSPNQRVSACQQIALSGNSGVSVSGNSYAPHLDYRIRFNSDKNKYVDILCPCKVSTKSNKSSNNDIDMTCVHSLFYSPYKFKTYNPNSDDTKRSLWRVEHGHCMTKNTDLLPDEIAP